MRLFWISELLGRTSGLAAQVQVTSALLSSVDTNEQGLADAHEMLNHSTFWYGAFEWQCPLL